MVEKKKYFSKNFYVVSCRGNQRKSSRRMRLFSTVGLTQFRPWTSTQDSRKTFSCRRPASSRSTFVSRSCSCRFCRSPRWVWLARWLLLSAASLRRISTPASRIERSSPLVKLGKLLFNDAQFRGLACFPCWRDRGIVDCETMFHAERRKRARAVAVCGKRRRS